MPWREHENPDMVGYSSTTDTPDFHFQHMGTTSATTEFAQVSVSFDLKSISKHINAVATTVQEAAALTPADNGLNTHMFQ